MGEARAESLLGDVGEAVVGVAGESSKSGESGVGTPGGGVEHRGRLLEDDADAAARGGVFEDVLHSAGGVFQVVALQAATGRSQGSEMGAGARATHPSDRRTWPRSTRRTMEGSIAWMGKGACVRLRASAGSSAGQARNKQDICSERERVRFLTRVGVCKRRGEEKCSLLCQRALTVKQTLGCGGGALQ